jgi:competence protein ComEC
MTARDAGTASRTRERNRSQRTESLALTPSLAVALLAGALVVQACATLPSIGFDIALACAGLFASSRPRLRLVAAFSIGFAWCAWRASVAFDARLPVALEGRDLDVVGIVDELPLTRGDATSATIRIGHATLDGADIGLRGRMRVAWYRAPRDALGACSRWHLHVRAKRPRGFVNPGGFDAERSALEHGIVATGYVRDEGPNGREGESAFCIDALRETLAREIDRRVSDPHDAALIRAFAIGDTRGLDDDDWQVARINGVPHLIAISGFHVGVAAGFGALLVRLFGFLFPRWLLRVPLSGVALPAALATGVFYGALAGGSLPTLRTLLMIATVAIARLGRRAGSASQALALAVTAIVIVDPLAVLSAGFWLSFVGVAFLLACLARGRGVLGFARELAIGQIVMSIALLPLSIWFFGEASLAGAISNLVAVPFVSFVIVPLCLLALLALLTLPLAAKPLLVAAAGCAHLQWQLFERIAALPGAHLYLPESGPLALAMAMLGAAWLLSPRGVPARALAPLLFLPIVLPAGAPPAPGTFATTFIDVGQGLSVLVRTRAHALLYDAGARYPSEFDLGKAAVLPTLHAFGVSHLDRLVISHGDNDHAGGAPALARAFPDADLVGGEPGRTALALRQCIAGESWNWDGVRFRVLSPLPEALGHSDPRGDNDRSCVLLVEGDDGRLLLPGDASTHVEPRIVAALGDRDSTPLILGVAHHGSRSASSASFIAAVTPALAIISAGWRNRFGHPHADVVERFRDAHVPLRDTATDGALTVTFGPDGTPLVRAERERRDRYWRE